MMIRLLRSQPVLTVLGRVRREDFASPGLSAWKYRRGVQDTLVGPYRITGLLGCGSVCALYSAEHVMLGRPAAVKVLPKWSHQCTVDRLFDEARATAAVRHPSIVEIYDFGWHSDGTSYLAMELLRGESLAARLSSGRMAPARATMIARQIAGALTAAHDNSIVHGSLTPGNVCLVPDIEVMGGERIKLLGFGIAKRPAGNHAHLTRTDVVVGTPMYMAPEQCRGLPVDHRADLYTLGCIMFQLYSGQPPFSGSVEDVFAAHMTMQPRALTGISDLSPELATVVRRLLAKNRDQRVQSAGELVQAIDAAIGVR
jgi:serine/threonine protein kinase